MAKPSRRNKQTTTKKPAESRPKPSRDKQKNDLGQNGSLPGPCRSWSPQDLWFFLFFSGFLDGFAMLPAGLFGLFSSFWFWNYLGRLPTTRILWIRCPAGVTCLILCVLDGFVSAQLLSCATNQQHHCFRLLSSKQSVACGPSKAPDPFTGLSPREVAHPTYYSRSKTLGPSPSCGQ